VDAEESMEIMDVAMNFLFLNSEDSGLSDVRYMYIYTILAELRCHEQSFLKHFLMQAWERERIAKRLGIHVKEICPRGI
jgi:hypothetical protein